MLAVEQLIGSDKQIAYAQSIIRSFQSLAGESQVPAIPSAQWWIEHRFQSFAELCESAKHFKDDFKSPFTTQYPTKHKDHAISTLQALANRNLIIFDTETTGLGKGNEIIEIAFVDIDETTLFSSRVRPIKAKMTESAQKVHGICIDDLADCRTFGEIWPDIEYIVQQSVLLSYNGAFDASMIRRSLDACGVEAPCITCTCIMRIVQAWFSAEDPLKLSEACERLGIDASQYGQCHGALADALAASAVLRRLIELAKEN
jgi:DNA polymerase III subunit epsilon